MAGPTCAAATRAAGAAASGPAIAATMRRFATSQVLQKDLKREARGQTTDQRTVVTILPSDEVQDGMLPVEQHLGVEDGERQVRFQRPLPCLGNQFLGEAL